MDLYIRDRACRANNLLRRFARIVAAASDWPDTDVERAKLGALASQVRVHLGTSDTGGILGGPVRSDTCKTNL